MAKDRSYSTAIHILTTLAYHAPEMLSSDALAKGLKTNPALVRRVLCKLSEQGLVESVKGKHGGNRLARSAREINLREVYLAVHEGPLFGTFEKEPYEPCPVSCQIGKVLERYYKQLDQDLQKGMSKVRLSQILREVT